MAASSDAAKASVDQRLTRRCRQAAPLKSLPGDVVDLDRFRVTRDDRIGGILHEYHLVA
jgi:hypothetical protein